ncbi:hypothetical protein [Sporichthya brevicatena]|uniref:hypothetical protein n=1 Tax=Sporichthya brevicatena TaxID=171442 RepID=UPI0031E21319
MTSPAAAPAVPWLPRETRWVGGFGLVAIVLLVVCWWQAAGEGDPSDQLPWLNLGTAAVLVYWVLAGRTLARARRRVAERRSAQLAALGSRPWLRSDAPSTPAGDGLVVAAGMTRAHRPECPLVSGKPTSPAPAGAPTCGICG